MPRAAELLRAYAAGWLSGNVDAVVESVAADVVVIESHGPTYLGRAEVRAWLEAWLAGGDVVHRWDLLSVIESEDGTHVAAEWDFACTAAGVRYDILGATIATASNGELTRITEYRREPEEP